MENRYMGPDGELFSYDGPGRTNTSLLTSLSEEFAHFREGWYKAKLNEICTFGVSSQNQDDVDLMRLYNQRLGKTEKSKKPKIDRKKFRQSDF